MPALDTFYKAHKAQGLKLIAISMDTPNNEAKVRAALKEFSFDGALAKNASFKGYGRIWRLPMTLVIDRKGTLQKDDWSGNHGVDAASLETTLSPLLKETM